MDSRWQHTLDEQTLSFNGIAKVSSIFVRTEHDGRITNRFVSAVQIESTNHRRLITDRIYTFTPSSKMEMRPSRVTWMLSRWLPAPTSMFLRWAIETRIKEIAGC